MDQGGLRNGLLSDRGSGADVSPVQKDMDKQCFLLIENVTGWWEAVVDLRFEKGGFSVQAQPRVPR